MPAAALTAVEAMERMASTGFNYGRATSEPGVWYFPTGKIGIYYADDGTTLTVQAVVDARHQHPMLLARCRHASVRPSSAMRLGPEAVARDVARTNPPAWRRQPER